MHGERARCSVPSVLPPLKREAVGTSESHPISLPRPVLSPSLHVVPSIRRPVPLPSLPPSFVFPHLNGPFNEGEKRARPPRPPSLSPTTARARPDHPRVRGHKTKYRGRERSDRGRIWGEGNERGRAPMERSHARRMRRFRRRGGRSRSSRRKIRALSSRCPRVSNGVRKRTNGQGGREDGDFLSGLTDRASERMSFRKRCECDRMDGWMARLPVASLALWPRGQSGESDR